MRALRRRRRWGRRHGRIRVREDVPMEERRAKVARPKGAFFFSFRVPNQARNPGQISGPESGPNFGTGIRAPNQARIPGFKLGPP